MQMILYLILKKQKELKKILISIFVFIIISLAISYCTNMKVNALEEEKNEVTPYEAMERVAKALPALTRSQKVYKKAKKSGLVQEEISEVFSQIKEKLESLENSLQTAENVQYDEEIGNLLLDIVNLSTFFNINAEFALTKSVEKFINRFRYIEN